MARIQTNPTQLGRAFAAAGISADKLAPVLTHLETERLERKRDMLKRAAGEAGPLRVGRPGWHPSVRHLKEELRQHLRDVQRGRTAFVMRFAGCHGHLKAGRPEAGLMSAEQAYDTYCERLSLIYEDIGARLQLGGFFDADGVDKTHKALQIFVANERAEGRPAGTAHWSQWEAPATVRNLRRIFNEIYQHYAEQNNKQWLRRLVPYFNSSTQGRLYEQWQDAIARAYGGSALSTSVDEHGVQRVVTSNAFLQRFVTEAPDLSEEQRAALLNYLRFISPDAKAFMKLNMEAASVATFEGKTPPYRANPMTGTLTYEPWRRLDDDALLRLHTHVIEIESARLTPELRAGFERYIPIANTQDEVDRRGLGSAAQH